MLGAVVSAGLSCFRPLQCTPVPQKEEDEHYNRALQLFACVAWWYNILSVQQQR